jgi:2-polyprenyl-6-methoxyphenol hydroxylase-like FAD-dependent oxidoreductase
LSAPHSPSDVDWFHGFSSTHRGAGPTGLVLAIRLARHGIAVRIIDKNSGPGQASRAMAVHARTLEFYRQLGFADTVVNLGIPIHAIRL